MAEKIKDYEKDVNDTVKEKTQSATGWVADKAERVRDGAVDLADTVQDRAKTMASSFADTAKRAKDKAGEWISDAAQPVEHLVEEGFRDTKQFLNNASRDATAMIRKYPITAVAIGLGLGLLLGRATNRVV